jgi:hypothetical protein
MIRAGFKELSIEFSMIRRLEIRKNESANSDRRKSIIIILRAKGAKTSENSKYISVNAK